jgi:hypothetical protein
LLIQALSIIWEDKKPMSTSQWRQAEKKDKGNKDTHGSLLWLMKSRTIVCF